MPRTPSTQTFVLAALLALAGAAQGANFTVNNASSDPDANIGNGSCATAGGACTLRAAIQEANALTGPHTITFQSAITTITLTVDLPVINSPVSIDGTNGNAASGNRVEINGDGRDCVSLADTTTAANPDGAQGSSVSNLVIRNCGGHGISLTGHDYTVIGNRIGTNAAGTASDPAMDANAGNGISLTGSATPPVALPDLSALLDNLPEDFAAIAAFSISLQAALTVIAEPNTITGNLISGNTGFGIELFGQNTVNTIIAGNIIGLDQAAGTALPNGHGGGNRAGILITSSAYGNFIGPGNIISGNNDNSSDDGIQIVPDAVLLPNFVMGNLVGPGNNPLAEVGNGGNGVVVDTEPDVDNLTGYSLILGPANTISDNQGDPMNDLDVSGGDTSGGIVISDSSNVLVFGNFIGMFQFPPGGTPIGELDVGNDGNGIVVTTGNHEIRNNLILGNGRHGILLRGSTGGANVTVQGNFIGVTDITGLDLFDFGNGGDGIQVFGSPVHTIGGPDSDDANVIAGNGRNGIKLSELGTSNTKSVLIERNSIYANAQDGEGIAIDLASFGAESNVANPVDNVVPNGNYPNFRQNAPVLCNNGGALAACAGLPPPSLDLGSGMLSASWAVMSSPDTPLRIEFYASDAPCSAGTGEGRDFLFSKDVTTDVAGLYSETDAFMPGGDAQGRCIALTATNLFPLVAGNEATGYPNNRLDGTEGPANATSEFSNGVLAVTPGSLAFAPASHNFGTVTVGAQADFDFTLAHVDGDAVTGITLGATGADFSVAGSTCGAEPFDLGPGEDCTVTARFAPAATGAAAGQLDANATFGDGDSATLTGNGQAPGALAFDAASVDFGGVVVGGNAMLTATLENTGGAAVDDITIAVTGAGFSRDGGTCPMVAFSLTGGSDCTVIVRFDPAATGAANGDLDAVGTGASANAALVGTGLAPAFLMFDMANYDFGSVDIGSNADLTATLSNSGEVAATNVMVSVTGTGFSREGGTCSMAAFSLPAGGNCTVLLRFAPAASGAAAGSVSASHDGGADANASLQGNGIEPGALAFDPTMLAFGDVPLGDSDTLTTTLENTGGVPVTGIQLAVTGAGFSRDGGTCAMGMFDLGAGANCTVIVRFEPVAAGMANGSLDATSTDGGAAAVALSGNGVAPGALAFDPASLDFGDVLVGDSDTLTTTLENTGGAAVDDIMIAVTGAGFSRDGGTCPIVAFSLTGGADCTVVVRFEPAMAGAASGDLDAMGTGASANAALAGSGLAPALLTFDMANYDFGSVEIGSNSDLTATLSNSGDVAAANVMVSVTGTGFSREGGTCSMAAFSLPAGGDCTVLLRFAPAASGAASGNLSASHDGGANADAGLQGNGIEPGALDFDPAMLTFGDVPLGDSDTLTTTLENTGGVPVTGVQLAVTGAGFSRDGGTCGMGMFDLAAGADCTVVIRFQPAAAGMANGSLDATSTDGGGAAVALSGNGVAPGALAFDPASLDFGDVLVGDSDTLATTLENTGGVPVTGIQLAVSGPGFSRDGGTCGMGMFDLAAGADCTVVIRFQPGLAGPASGSLDASSVDGGGASAALIGNGQAPGDLVFSQASIDFGPVVTGSAGAAQTVTLSNPGDLAVDNVMIAVSGTGFSRDGGSCALVAFSLAAGADCTVTVRFQPAATGPASGSLDAMGDGGTSASVALSGEGIQPGALAFDPAALAFGDVEVGSSATLTTTLENTGGVTVTGIDVVASGAGFSRDGGTCSTATFDLAAGADCTVVVRFQPAAAGPASGSVAATSTSGGAMANLSGNGTEPPPPPVTFDPPGGLDFGGVPLGDDATLVLTIENTSGGMLTGLVIVLGGDFSILVENCTPSLAAGAQCQAQIVFAPTAVGLRSGNLLLTADGGVSASIGLTGSGLPAGGIPEAVAVPGAGRIGLLLLVLLLIGVGMRQLGQVVDPRG